MVRCAKRWLLFVGIALFSLFTLLPTLTHRSRAARPPIERLTHPGFFRPKFRWRDVPQRHPVDSYIPLPSGPAASIPKIQATFVDETSKQAAQRQQRLQAVKDAFVHSWEGYKTHAWLNDEVAPLTGKRKNGFGGWGATLVDSLDTLWIMGMEEEFEAAVSALKKLDFTTAQLLTLNVFETTIRYLGGLLSAYDVSGHQYGLLLEKAIELGDMLYVAFDTPNRMPVTRWDWQNGALGGEQVATSRALVAEVGSMTLEFTRLSQLTGDDKYYDAVSRVTDLLADWQNHTRSPGLWPINVDTAKPDLHNDKTFTLGGMADSLYEYFPKQHLLLGGRSTQYRDMYHTALEAAKERLFFRPLNPKNEQILLSGTMKLSSSNNARFIAEAQHLTCFVGGMVGLAAKVFKQGEDLETARQLTDGCVWAYESMPTGVMPEIFRAVACDENGTSDKCAWSDESWYEAIGTIGSPPDKDTKHRQAQAIIESRKLPPGMISITDARYGLRPEAIESVFVLYRITGDETLREKAWKMFQSITNHTKTEIGYASITDVTEAEPILYDSMESYWFAESLKYFYLIFSEPEHVSLDDYVFNTEAHPLLRPKEDVHFDWPLPFDVPLEPLIPSWRTARLAEWAKLVVLTTRSTHVTSSFNSILIRGDDPTNDPLHTTTPLDGLATQPPSEVFHVLACLDNSISEIDHDACEVIGLRRRLVKLVPCQAETYPHPLPRRLPGRKDLIPLGLIVAGSSPAGAREAVMRFLRLVSCFFLDSC